MRPLLMVVFGILVVPTAANSCSCLRQTVEEAYKNAEIVFQGKIVAIEGPISYGAAWPAGTVRFIVSKSWKGDVPREFEMPAVDEGTACIGFYRSQLKRGNELLVYAQLIAWTPTGQKAYFTDACTRSALLKDAQEDLAALPNISGSQTPKRK